MVKVVKDQGGLLWIIHGSDTLEFLADTGIASFNIVLFIRRASGTEAGLGVPTVTARFKEIGDEEVPGSSDTILGWSNGVNIAICGGKQQQYNSLLVLP